MKLNVNVDTMLTLLTAIMKVIPGDDTGAKFVISENNTIVQIQNESHTVRAHFKTNAISSEDNSLEINFRGIPNLFRAFNMVQKYYNKKDMNITVDFNGTFLSYDNTVKFKLKVIKDSSMIQKYISPDLKSTNYNKTYIFRTNDKLIKRLLQFSNIATYEDEKTKVYFSHKDNEVIGEIDDKTNPMSNSIGLPIGEIIEGEMSNVAVTRLTRFKTFSLLPVDNIDVAYLDVGAFNIESRYTNENEDKYIDLQMICSLIKA